MTHHLVAVLLIGAPLIGIIILIAGEHRSLVSLRRPSKYSQAWVEQQTAEASQTAQWQAWADQRICAQLEAQFIREGDER